MAKSRKVQQQSSLKQSRACDTCKGVKAKCDRAASEAVCRRCARLGHDCTFDKEQKPPGRKPASSTGSALLWIEERPEPTASLASTSTSSPSVLPESDAADDASQLTIFSANSPNDSYSPPSSLSSATSLQILPLSLGESHLVDYMLDESEDHPLFRLVTTPSVKTAQINAIKEHLASAPALLLVPFVVMWKRAFNQIPGGPACDEVDMTRSSNSLSNLRTMVMDSTHRVTDVLCLAFCLMTFDEAIHGSAAPAICRHSLSLLQNSPHADGIWSDTTAISVVLYHIWIDTMESLIRRRIPVMRSQVFHLHKTDLYSGITATILPNLYDVCRIGCAVKAGIHVDEPSRYTIETGLRNWTPSPGSDIWERPAHHIMLLATHATLFQAMGIVLILQYLHPLDRLDERASLVRGMLDDLNACKSSDGNGLAHIALSAACGRRGIGRQPGPRDDTVSS